MPWSAKAQELLREQYAAVSAAASGALSGRGRARSERAAARGRRRSRALLERYRAARALVTRYTRRVSPLLLAGGIGDDLRLAPFHLLATEGAVHADKDHAWHMGTASRSARPTTPGVLFATPHRVVDLTDPASEAARWRGGRS